MSSIWSMMDIGKRSMMNSQTALQTVSHNIANKSTKGYSRQRVEVVANEPITKGRLQIGSGASTTRISRINNQYLEKQLEGEQNQLGFLKARDESLSRVEQVFNEQSQKGLNHFLGEFFNSFRELSNNPESLATRTAVKESAHFLTKDFSRAVNQLKDIQKDIDFQIASHVEEINEMTREIAQLNEKIQTVELNGVPANDERDRRDQLIKELSEKINIRYAEGKDGAVTITAGNSAVLVSGHSHRDLIVASTPGREGKQEGNFDILYKASENSNPINVTAQITGGAVGGLLDVRDKVVNNLLDQLDEMAYSLAQEVNKAHVEGFNRYNKKGVLFFEPLKGVKGAAESLRLNPLIQSDVGQIAAAAQPNAPGDNRIANILSSLQYKKVLQDKTSTFDDFYNSIVSKVGIETSRARSAFEAQSDIFNQLKNLRESISGVSLDEEATKMIEFQKSFDASARMIRAADEMMDTVLNLKRY
ncbi:MAG: flagellar hook-associated protein FlgK [Bdellovibrio sp.]|nr:MAG: flagellar hook-associated protein FlgK [Bdellovibrio sp.]